MVRVMDHDCAWVGCCIGEGNHRAFLAMAISGELALLLCAHALWLHLAQRGGVLRLLRLITLASPHAMAAAVVHARLLLLVALLCALLLLLLTPLLLGQVALTTCRPAHPACNPTHPACNPTHPACKPVHPTCNPLCPGFARRLQHDHRRVHAHRPHPGASPHALAASPPQRVLSCCASCRGSLTCPSSLVWTATQAARGCFYCLPLPLQDLDRGHSPRAAGCRCHLPAACRAAKHAPHSRGLLRNVLAFAMAQRSVALAEVVPAPDSASL